MRNFVTLGADRENYDGRAEDLPRENNPGNPHVHCYDFSVSPGAEASQIVLMGRGLLFENDWSLSGTVSTIVEDLTPAKDHDAYDAATDHMDAVTHDMNPIDGFRSTAISDEREIAKAPVKG